MEWRSAWWGIQIQAENEDDKILLEKLQRSLMGKLPYENRYDDGELHEIKDEKNLDDTWGFRDLGEMTLEFLR